ncbi:caspase family protein [Winogradskyella thalassocola]|uniref:Tetratricopeptide repeat-containing protein n=1 Tax=Winogradskyella thalassocola TaxID=262004 RepID=A0A1G7YXJ4_9FLAO|nr:tetratricopeptide repeat protein [Winogradskyella thalassocola]SDH00969.1 Tetratricopeptide repeat-containing protein [Winogradskyella thalassocola]
MKQLLLYFFSLLSYLCFAQEDSRGSKAQSTEAIEEGTKRAIVIGVSDYNEEGLRLKYADNDAILFKNYLSQIEELSNENISLLINTDAVALNIVQEFKKLIKKSESGDINYIYFAGHGDVVDDFGEKEGFLLAADANAKQEYYSGGVIPLALLNKIINALTTKGSKVVLILDACKSGFVFEEGTQKNMGTIQAMFENSTKILSCGSNELSYESGDLNHGYFTYFLVKGLTGKADSNTDNSIQYREIDDYLYENVFNIVSKKYNKNQTPIVRTQNDRAVLKSIKPETNTIAFEAINVNFESDKAIASRGINETKLSDKSGGMVITKFNEAIERNSYYGKSSSAYEIYKSSINNASISDGLKEKMQSMLLKILSNSAQQLINTYIDGDKALPPSRAFNIQAKHLEICLELMGEDGFLRDRIEASKLLLESYAIIRTRNFAKYEAAKHKLNNALNLEPRAAYIHNALGEVYNQEELYDSAHYHYNEAKKLIVSWSQPFTNIGDNLMDQYKFDDAKTYLNTSLGTKGANTNLKLGEINEKEGKYNIAETYYATVLKTEPENTFALQKMSHLQKLKGNTKASIDWYKKSVKTDSINSIFGYGLVNYIQDHKIEDEAAEKLLLNAIDYAPESSMVYSEYANFLSLKKTRLSRLRLADSLYRKAIENDPFNTWAYAGRGVLQHKMRKPLKAKESFETGITNNKTKPESYFHYANYLKNELNKNDEAEKLYLTAIEKNGYFIPAYNAIITLYNSQNLQDKSIALLNSAIKKHPNTPDLHHLLGQTFFSQSNYNDAILAYQKATHIDSSYVKSSQNLGYSQLENNLFEAAKSQLSTAAESDPYGEKQKEISEFILTMAKDRLKFGKPEDTNALYKLAFEISNSSENAYVYSEFLYLQSEPIKAIEIALPALGQNNTKAQNIQLLEVMVKAAIDANAFDNANYYYSNLIKLDQNPDLLLASVYSRFIGDLNSSEKYRLRTDPNLLRSNKLKSLYSQNTIDKYILSN